MVRAASDILAAAARSISCRHEFKSMAAEEQVGDPRIGARAGDLEMAIVMVYEYVCGLVWFGLVLFARNVMKSQNKKNTTGSVF